MPFLSVSGLSAYGNMLSNVQIGSSQLIIQSKPKPEIQYQAIGYTNQPSADYITVPIVTDMVNVPMATDLVHVPKATDLVHVPTTTDLVQVPMTTDLVHVPTATRTTRRCCYCRDRKVLTANGSNIYSTYRCEMCDVTLCNGKRNCFEVYHKGLGIPVNKTIGHV